MKNVPIYLFILLLFSCNKVNNPSDLSIPSCIQEILDDNELSKDIRTVRLYEVDNELHYWLNTDFTEFDGTEYIVNMQCDTVCLFCGFCDPPECSEEYTDEWITIWEN